MADNLLSYYKRLKTRERILTILLITVVVATLYYRFLYRPVRRNVTTYKFQVQKLRARLNELNSQLPPIDERKENLRAVSSTNEKILNEIEETEKQLPGKEDASRLIGELARLAEGLELISIQQKLDKGKLYSRIFVELTFSAPYKETVNYIERIETISPFLKIEEMDVSEPKGKQKSQGIRTSLLVSCLLGEAPVSEWLRSEEIYRKKETEAASEVRDIFASKSKTILAEPKTDLKLEGITYNPQGSTAIINDDVVKVGSEINGYKVKDILPDAVILTDGKEEYVLNIE